MSKLFRLLECTLVLLFLNLLWPSAIAAQSYVKGYTRKDGIYIAPHYRSSPNSTKLDNWSIKGNVNPFTGKVGTKNPYVSMPTFSATKNNGENTFPAMANSIFHFGTLSTKDAGKPKFEETNKILRDERTKYGWFLKVGREDAVEVTQRLEAPGPTRWSKNVMMLKNGKIGISKTRMTPIDGWIFGSWGFFKEDPDGEWKLTIFVDGVETKTFTFNVDRKPSDKKLGTKTTGEGLFKQASKDCSYMRGSTAEDYCIEQRLQAIKNLEALSAEPLFEQASKDCRYIQGSTAEDYCVKQRINAIENIARLKSESYFSEAQRDCNYMHGSTAEDYCIRQRINAIKKVALMRTQYGAKYSSLSAGEYNRSHYTSDKLKILKALIGADSKSDSWDEKADQLTRQFQKENGLSSDGKIGPDSLRVLLSTVNALPNETKNKELLQDYLENLIRKTHPNREALTGSYSAPTFSDKAYIAEPSRRWINEGEEVEYFDYESGEYKVGEVESVSLGEAEVYNWESGEYDYVDLDDIE